MDVEKLIFSPSQLAWQEWGRKKKPSLGCTQRAVPQTQGMLTSGLICTTAAHPAEPGGGGRES